MNTVKKFKCRICGCGTYSKLRFGQYDHALGVHGEVSPIEVPYENPYRWAEVVLHVCDGCSVVFVDKRMSSES